MTTVTKASHRLGSRVDYLPRLQGPSADWAEVRVAADGERLVDVVRLTRVTVRRRSGVMDASRVEDLSLDEAAALTPDSLLEVRRPVSYKGMRNYIGRMALPSQVHEAHAGWFESRNEQEHYRELLMRHAVVQMATQPLRLAWAFPSGVRTHVPDAFHLTVDGRATLVDVTRRKRLETPEAVAIFLLAQATARAMGWRYELHDELSPQHQRNVSLVYSHRHATPSTHTWRAAVKGMPATQQVLQAAQTLGAGTSPNYAAVWHLVATRHLFIDLARALTPDAVVRRRPLSTRSNPCLISL